MSIPFQPDSVPSALSPRRRNHGRWRWAIVAFAGVVALCVLAKPAAILAIEGYQRYVSPHKGFHCAYGKLHGGLTCSAFGKKAIAENGVVGGAILLRDRFRQCHQAAATLSAQRCDSGPRAGDCGESAGERGERETKEYKEYCCGSCQGCCGK